MLEFQEDALDVLAVDGLTVSLIRLTAGGPPTAELRVGGHGYRYDRSYPIKGYSATMPGYLQQQLAAGKQPLIIERADRFYVYLEGEES